MSVHFEKRKILTMIFEARYDEGFRLLDHTGELIVKMRSHNAAWEIAATAQRSVVFVHRERNLSVSVGVDKVDVSLMAPVSLADGEKAARQLGDAAEAAYSTTIEALQISKTTRVASRFTILAPTDTLEEGDRFTWKAAASDFRDAVVKMAKGAPSEASLTYVLDDPETGLRQRVTLQSIVVDRKPEDPPFHGLPGEKGSGGVVVDVDNYKKPDSEQLSKVSMFVQAYYNKSITLAENIVRWVLNPKK